MNQLLSSYGGYCVFIVNGVKTMQGMIVGGTQILEPNQKTPSPAFIEAGCKESRNITFISS